MRGYNRVILVGTVGMDPESTLTKNGKLISRFRMVTNESKKNDKGEYENVAQWHTVKLFGNLAEVAGDYVRKGSRVCVEGRINYNQFQKDDSSPKITYTSIAANGLTLIGKLNNQERELPEGLRENSGGAASGK